MLSNIIGIIAMVFGALGIINPGGFKKRVRRRMNLRMKLVVYLFIAIFAAGIGVNALSTENMLSKIGALVGLIITIKVIIFITSKSSDKFSEFLETRSLNFFRAWALLVFFMGAMLVLG